MRTLIIAEPGGTHEGRLDTMHRLVDVAADCGANVFKSQWTSDAALMSARRHAPEYLDSYRLLQYPLEWHDELRDHAKTRGLQYACTAYIPGDPTKLAPLVDYLKISSFEANDLGLIEEALRVMSSSRATRNVIVSLGMNGDGDVLGPLLLHCVSSYPAPLQSLSLATIRRDHDNGFSDHSHDVRVGAWAVCAGASILETHFRLDDCDPANKDYAVAFTPAEFTAYIRNVRDAELALGDGVKRIQDCEKSMLSYRVTA